MKTIKWKVNRISHKIIFTDVRWVASLSLSLLLSFEMDAVTMILYKKRWKTNMWPNTWNPNGERSFWVFFLGSLATLSLNMSAKKFSFEAYMLQLSKIFAGIVCYGSKCWWSSPFTLNEYIYRFGNGKIYTHFPFVWEAFPSHVSQCRVAPTTSCCTAAHILSKWINRRTPAHAILMRDDVSTMPCSGLPFKRRCNRNQLFVERLVGNTHWLAFRRPLHSVITTQTHSLTHSHNRFSVLSQFIVYSCYT